MSMSIASNIRGYEVRESLGTGGFGAVYRAFQPGIGREVAIKMILPGMANQPDFIRRFEAEAQIIARLEHPHITPLYDYWRDPDGAYLVMRWLRGGSLRDVLKEPFELRAAALLIDQVAGALALAHRNNVIHRDIKPGNILLDEDGNAYLTDFGIAKDLNLEGSQTEADAIIGSLDYISPEQARSETVTPRTDIYSLGVTLYEMIAGHHPFHTVSSIERLYKHINDPLPEITSLDPAVAAGINRVIQKATAKNPENRYADALAFAADFRAAANLDQSASSVVELLTQREQEILQLVVAGLSNKEIAQQLTVTLSTVKWYVNQIYSKLGVRSRVQAMVRARDLNLLGKTLDLPAPAAIPTEDFHPENPYKGLRAFQSADHNDFFGRARLTSKLIKRLGDGGEYGRFLAVIGPSGSGKSSLVKAGLIPALWRGDFPGSEKWFLIEMLPGARPLDELEIALTKIAANQAGNLHEQLARDQHGLLRAASLILPNDNSDLVLVIDQFEEIFTLVEEEAARVHFLNLLLAAVTDPRSRVRVIITLRADFYDRPLHYPQFGEMLRSSMETILPLSAQELEFAIRKPAERVGVSFETGLVSSIVADVNYQAGALPLLQYALTELFEQRQGRLLTHEAYQSIGKTIGALAKRAEELYHDLDNAGREAVRQLFLRLVTLGEGAEDTRRRTSRDELLAMTTDPDLMDEIIDTFAGYRLLSLDTDPGTRTPTVEVAHEAILREWERLRVWLNESREDIKLQRQLSTLTAEWQHAHQDTSFLLRGARLDTFEKWASATPLALTPQEQAYLTSSLQARQQEKAAEIARQMREQTLEQRSHTFLRGLVAVFALAAVIAIGLSFFAFGERSRAESALASEAQARRTAEENADYARSLALASAARVALNTNNSDQAIALAVAASTNTASPSIFVQNALYDAAFTPATTRLIEGGELSGAVHFSADGNKVLSAWDGLIVLRDLISGNEIARFDPDPTQATKWSGDVIWAGDTAFTSTFTLPSMTGILVRFDPYTAQTLMQYPFNGKGIYTLEVSPDQRFLVGGTVDGRILVWDFETGAFIRRFTENHIFIEDLVFDGDTLWSGSDDGQVIQWDFASGEPRQVFAIPDHAQAWVTHVMPSEIGLLTVWNDANVVGKITLWNPESGTVIQELAFDVAPSAVTLSQDARLLVVGLSNGEIHLYDTQTWEKIEQLYGHTRRIGSIHFHNGTLVTTSTDGAIRFWNIENPAIEMRLAAHHDFLWELTLSEDGARGLSVSNNGQAILWDMMAGTPEREIMIPDNTFTVDANLSADGTQFLAWNMGPPDSGCNARNQLRLYDAATGDVIRQFNTQSGDLITWAAFHPDGQHIVTSDNGECSSTLKIWDITTGEQVNEWAIHQPNTGAFRHQFSPDGRYMVSGSYDTTAVIVDAATGKPLHILPHSDFVGTIMFSSDSRYLVTGSGDALIHLWDVNTGAEIRRYTGHSSMIERAIFSPDGRYILSSSRDQFVILWDVATGEILRQWHMPQSGRAGAVINFSADGQSIYVSDETNAIQKIALYLDPNELLGWIQQNRYVRDLTCDERVLYQVEPLCEGGTNQISIQ